ncbi:hypothetical protein [Eisenibacter elegans]|jgi:hypothetical protein|uniref:hypothetical protein n=1 Tax=Eisenibacter elegans TaxID=997 RepID=UPI00040E9A40|nr:hypothetical protein [Eisenibacter elegans]
MITYADTDYMRIEFDKSLNAMIYRWKSGNHGMSDEEYKTEMRRCIECIKTYRPLTVIAYMVDSNFSIHPALQDWLNKEIIASLFPNGCRYAILVESADFIARLSLEQVFADKTEERVGSVFVSTLEEAYGYAQKFLGESQ